ncbi:MAG TPA: hypothetical protein DIT03_06045 [Candidatus Accumulibacter sp.]|nr:hypothetical protein [Accumulibacter sp.]HCN67827.1 hypothetical protein [Accumulibacter sp.]
MIPLAPFVIVTNAIRSGQAVMEPVLEAMPARRQGFGKPQITTSMIDPSSRISFVCAMGLALMGRMPTIDAAHVHEQMSSAPSLQSAQSAQSAGQQHTRRLR